MSSSGRALFLKLVNPIIRHPAIRPKLVRYLDESYDREHNVDTAGEIQLAEMELKGDSVVHGMPYAGTPVRTFRRLLRSLKFDFKPFVFIDFGSGKGRAMFLAAEFPFRKIVGIEFAPQLAQVAQKNLKTFRSQEQKCSDIEALEMDAMKYEFPPEPLFLYFLNPFDRTITDPVLANMKRSLETNPRPAYVLYVNGLKERILDDVPFLEKLAEGKIPRERYCFYRVRTES